MPNERKMDADLVRSPRFDFNLFNTRQSKVKLSRFLSKSERKRIDLSHVSGSDHQTWTNVQLLSLFLSRTVTLLKAGFPEKYIMYHDYACGG